MMCHKSITVGNCGLEPVGEFACIRIAGLLHPLNQLGDVDH